MTDEIKNEADVKFVAKENLIIKKDEKILIEIYRFIRDKLTWRFFLGTVLGVAITWLIMK